MRHTGVPMMPHVFVESGVHVEFDMDQVQQAVSNFGLLDGGIALEGEQHIIETCSSHPNHSHREVGFVVTAKKRLMVMGLGSYFYIGRAPPSAVLHLFHRPGRHQFGHVPHLTDLQSNSSFEHVEVTLTSVSLKRIYTIATSLQILIEPGESHTFVMVCEQDIEYCPDLKIVQNDDVSIIPSGARESLWGGLVNYRVLPTRHA